MSSKTIRTTIDRDRESILRIWHQGWHDAHGKLVPPSILVYRTPKHFATWLKEGKSRTFVAEDEGGIAGFYMLDGAELSKLYVRRAARGSGIAQALLSHAEDGLASQGVTEAELFCTVGNRRAQRFYERHGWRWAKTFDDDLWCPEPGIDVPSGPTHRYTKTLSRRHQ
ncbi:MAG: GNAT family N-acetyltransferase [Geminicoccaceae bacterium]